VPVCSGEEAGVSESGGGREQMLSRAFVSLADTLVDDYDVIDMLDRLVAYSVELLAADAAGLMLADASGQLLSVASSSEDAHLMEVLQLQTEQGPCVECFHTSSPVSVPDLTDAASRWPRFVSIVSRRGPFASVHALPLRLRGQAIGALNLLHREPGPLPADDLALGQALADVATIGILQERAIHRTEVVNEQLQTALNSRVIIEQAKGVLAAHSSLGVDAAFNLLRGYARSRRLGLASVAREVVERRLDPTTITTAAVEAPRRRA
jgi:GAF domain-containing protein